MPCEVKIVLRIAILLLLGTRFSWHYNTRLHQNKKFAKKWQQIIKFFPRKLQIKKKLDETVLDCG